MNVPQLIGGPMMATGVYDTEKYGHYVAQFFFKDTVSLYFFLNNKWARDRALIKSRYEIQKHCHLVTQWWLVVINVTSQ